jgi:hypothetical protein
MQTRRPDAVRHSCIQPDSVPECFPQRGADSMKTREASGGKSVKYTDAKRNAASPTKTIRFANAIFLLLSPRCFVQLETILSHRLSQLPVSRVTGEVPPGIRKGNAILPIMLPELNALNVSDT